MRIAIIALLAACGSDPPVSMSLQLTGPSDVLITVSSDTQAADPVMLPVSRELTFLSYQDAIINRPLITATHTAMTSYATADVLCGDHVPDSVSIFFVISATLEMFEEGSCYSDSNELCSFGPDFTNCID